MIIPFKQLLIFALMLFNVGLLYGQHPKTSIKINQEVYYVLLDNDILSIEKLTSKTTLLAKGSYSSFMVKDFDNDGYKDILAEVQGTNTPAVYDMLKYDPSNTWFSIVKNFSDFPQPLAIHKTGYYYSYHKNGCADECWESDLFYIKGYKAVRIGNIDREILDATKGTLAIYKVHNGKRNPFKTLPLNTENKYKGGKFEFIKTYWFKNYKLFL